MEKEKRFRHSAGFGKRIEYNIIAEMLKEGLDIYTPLVDDNGIDAVVRKADGSFAEIQIKARSKDVTGGNEALFAAIRHQKRPNYWFIFYSESLDKKWILSSEEFIDKSYMNKKGKNEGSRNIKFSGKKNGLPYALPKYQQFEAKNYNRILEAPPSK